MPVVTGNVEILHRAQMGQDVYIYGIRTYHIYIYIYIHIYRQFSVFTTSVGRAQLAPIIFYSSPHTCGLPVRLHSLLYCCSI